LVQKRFRVVAGDFKEGNAHQVLRGRLLMKSKGLFREKIPLSHISDLDVASEQSVNRIGGAIALGLAGEVVFGPLGLLAGLVRGGRGRDVTFVCRLMDGRRFLAIAGAKEFSQMQLAATKANFLKSYSSHQPARMGNALIENQKYSPVRAQKRSLFKRLLRLALLIFVIIPIGLCLIAGIVAVL
jgi:hypothetical protein